MEIKTKDGKEYVDKGGKVITSGKFDLDKFIDELRESVSMIDMINKVEDDDERIRVMNRVLKYFDPLSDELRNAFTPRDGDSERIKKIKKEILEHFPVMRNEIGVVF